MSYQLVSTAPHQACYTKNGLIVPPQHVLERLNELERLRAAFEKLADKMEFAWGHHGEGGWRLPSSLKIRSDREQCFVNDLVNQLLSSQDTEN